MVPAENVEEWALGTEFTQKKKRQKRGGEKKGGKSKRVMASGYLV